MFAGLRACDLFNLAELVANSLEEIATCDPKYQDPLAIEYYKDLHECLVTTALAVA